MKLKEIDHIHFFATNLDETINFYKDIGFNFIRKHKHSGREAAQLKSDFGLVIDINKTEAADNPGYSHFSIKVDDIEKSAVTLKELGYEFDGPTYNKDTKRWILTLRDPNGFLVQLVKSN